MEENVHFSPKDILQKEFRQKMRGYDPNEVDVFLDSVIKDYGIFNREIQKLQDENSRLRNRVDELNRQLEMSQVNANGVPSNDDYENRHTSGNTATNIDILKRLSNLEKRVFGSQMGSDGNESHRF